jgi:hypothetical protein
MAMESCNQGCPAGVCELAARGQGYACSKRAIKSAAQQGWERECADADQLLRLLGFEPDRCRTEAGSLNLPLLRDALRTRDEQPTPIGWTWTYMGMRHFTGSREVAEQIAATAAELAQPVEVLPVGVVGAAIGKGGA